MDRGVEEFFGKGGVNFWREDLRVFRDSNYKFYIKSYLTYYLRVGQMMLYNLFFT